MDDTLVDRTAAPPAPASATAPAGAAPSTSPRGPIADPVTPAEREALLAAIVADARRAPEAYLRETVVPEGGE
jgi:hypothetical protein